MPKKKDPLLGQACLQHYAKKMPSLPGVYRMLDAQQRVLYVGKARHLRKRVLSHSRDDGHSPQLSWFLTQVACVDFLVTETEAEALLLEADIIKNDLPIANVLMKDDKSYPFLLITKDEIPRMMLFRENKKSHRKGASGGRLFGPFSSTGEVETMIRTLQASFLLRVCPESVYRGRKRPCLLYQIKRCSAPCMNYITPQDYALRVAETLNALEKQTHKQGLLKSLFQKAHKASQARYYELARTYHARLRSVRNALIPQRIRAKTFKDADIFAIVKKKDVCIQWFSFRDGRPLRHERFFPKTDESDTEKSDKVAILEHFLEGFLNQSHASLILVNVALSGRLEEQLSAKRGKKIRIHHPLRGEKKAFIHLAQINAEVMLSKNV